MRYLDVMQHIVREATKNSGGRYTDGNTALSVFVAVQSSNIFIVRIVDKRNAIYEDFSVDLADPEGLDIAIRKLRFSMNSISRDLSVVFDIMYVYRGDIIDAKNVYRGDIIDAKNPSPIMPESGPALVKVSSRTTHSGGMRSCLVRQAKDEDEYAEYVRRCKRGWNYMASIRKRNDEPVNVRTWKSI